MFQPPLVPDTLDVPAFKAFDTFALIALDMDRAEEDFALVDANRDHLAGVFGPRNKWPEGVDLRRNKADVAWHEVEFGCRTSFAYWITEAPRADAPLIGCLYITPSPRADDDCAVYFWLAKSHDARAAEVKPCWKCGSGASGDSTLWRFRGGMFRGRSGSGSN